MLWSISNCLIPSEVCCFSVLILGQLSLLLNYKKNILYLYVFLTHII